MKELSPQPITDSVYARSDITHIDNAFQYFPRLANGYLIADTALYSHPDKPYATKPSTLQQLEQSLCVPPNMLSEVHHHDWLFSKLNIDTLDCVFQYLNKRDMLRCAGVNKQWCWFLLRWPHFWKTIMTNASRAHGQLFETVLYRRRINKLMLHGSSKYHQYFADTLLDLMADTHYSQLASIHIEAMQKVDQRTLTRVLCTSNINLTMLYLDRCAYPHEVLFGTILNECPLLVELYYKQHTERDTRHYRGQTNKVHRKRLALRKLMIDLGNKQQQTNTFLPYTLQKCPNLQLLFWNPIDHINHDSVFHSLNTFCPHLQWLSIVKKEDQEDMNRFVNFQRHYIPPKSGQSHRGLTLLDISHNGITMETSTLEDLLQMHHLTLRTIALPDVKTRLFRQALPAMQKYPLINLDQATLGFASCADNPVPSMLFDLFSSWKNLNAVSLNYYNGDTLEILEALVHLQKLEAINIPQCSSEAIQDVSSALRAWMKDKYKISNIKELSLDCKVFQHINPEHLFTGFFGLINMHIIHSSTSTMTFPCTCQYNGIMYKTINARKILNHRGGDVYASTVV